MFILSITLYNLPLTFQIWLRMVFRYIPNFSVSMYVLKPSHFLSAHCQCVGSQQDTTIGSNLGFQYLTQVHFNIQTGGVTDPTTDLLTPFQYNSELRENFEAITKSVEHIYK